MYNTSNSPTLQIYTFSKGTTTQDIWNALLQGYNPKDFHIQILRGGHWFNPCSTEMVINNDMFYAHSKNLSVIRIYKLRKA